MVTVRFRSEIAYLSDGNWRCSNKTFESMLNSIQVEISSEISYGQNSLDMRHAKLMIQRLKFGEIVSGDLKETPFKEGVLY